MKRSKLPCKYSKKEKTETTRPAWRKQMLFRAKVFKKTKTEFKDNLNVKYVN